MLTYIGQYTTWLFMGESLMFINDLANAEITLEKVMAIYKYSSTRL